MREIGIMTDKNVVPNRLINEKSPYLLQHTHNPVDWFPWSKEAFDKAKAENKPIFYLLGTHSVGYRNQPVIGGNPVTVTKKNLDFNIFNIL